MEKRKWHTLLCAAVLCVCFLAVWPVSGCGRPGAGEAADGKAQAGVQTGQTAGAGPQPQEEEQPLRIGISIYRYDDEFMTQYRKELTKYLKETYQAEVVIQDARDDQKIQDRQVAQMIKSGCDALIVNPVKASSVGFTVDACRDAEIPVVFINREPDGSEIRRWEEEKLKASYVGTDSKQAGAYQGEIVLETESRGDFNGDGAVSYVMIMGDAESKSAAARTEYSVKALADAGFRTEKLMKQRGNWERGRGEELAKTALQRFGSRVEVIFCNNDAMADGARKAIEAAGRTVGEDILLVGVDALEDTVRDVKEGKVTGTVFNDYVGQSHTAADTAVRMIRGEKVDYRYDVDYVKITMTGALEQE